MLLVEFPMYYRDKTLIYLISYTSIVYICSGLLKGLLEVFTFQFCLLQYYSIVQKVLWSWALLLKNVFQMWSNT